MNEETKPESSSALREGIHKLGDQIAQLKRREDVLAASETRALDRLNAALLERADQMLSQF